MPGPFGVHFELVPLTRHYDATIMSTTAAQPVTNSTTVIIDRVLALYCLFNTLTSIPALRNQWPTTATWWMACFVPLYAVVLTMMTYRSFRRRPIGRWAGAYAILTLLALVTGLFAFGDTPHTPWLWWLVGQAIVCAFVWRGTGPGPRSRWYRGRVGLPAGDPGLRSTTPGRRRIGRGLPPRRDAGDQLHSYRDDPSRRGGR